MKSLALICTVHIESGHANSAELYARLERFRPDVVFLEAPANDLGSFIREHGHSKLEVDPVRQYQSDSGATLVAVDLATPPEQFFRDYEAVVQQVKNASRNHRRLMTWHSNYIADYGFPYLNSEYNCNLLAQIKADFESTVAELADSKISAHLEAWNSTNALREHEMLKNISSHCAKHVFERAVFIVGSAHRRSLIEKSHTMQGVQWAFSDLLVGQ